MLSFTTPDNYGNVILGCAVLPCFVSIYMGGKVMKAREEFSVPYPNLYATPGFHKKADEFNRCQRGHQGIFEQMISFTAFGLIGGLKHPMLATAAGILFSLGSVFYQVGYADSTLDIKIARYKKGGGLKHVGFLLALGTCVSVAGSMNGWWK